VRSILKRERIRRNSRMLSSIPSEARRALDGILGRSRGRATRRPRH